LVVDRKRWKILSLAVVLLTIPAPSWYYQPAKKPAAGWICVSERGEGLSAHLNFE
jgi:hypothetical protein